MRVLLHPVAADGLAGPRVVPPWEEDEAEFVKYVGVCYGEAGFDEWEGKVAGELEEEHFSIESMKREGRVEGAYVLLDVILSRGNCTFPKLHSHLRRSIVHTHRPLSSCTRTKRSEATHVHSHGIHVSRRRAPRSTCSRVPVQSRGRSSVRSRTISSRFWVSKSAMSYASEVGLRPCRRARSHSRERVRIRHPTKPIRSGCSSALLCDIDGRAAEAHVRVPRGAGRRFE